MINHSRYKHPAQWKEYSDLKPKDCQPPVKKQRLNFSNEEKREIDELITEMIAIDMLSYSFVENRGFRKLLNKIIPGYEPPYRTTISRTLMPNLFEKCQTNVRQQLQKAFDDGLNCLSYTTDGWTSKAGDSYLSLTAHYLTSNFEPKNFLLGMRHVKTGHTANEQAQLLEEMAEEWNFPGIEDVPIYCVTDNARNITNTVQKLGWDNIYCFAHTLNLALSDAQENYEALSEILAKVKLHFSQNYIVFKKM